MTSDGATQLCFAKLIESTSHHKTGMKIVGVVSIITVWFIVVLSYLWPRV